MKGDDQHSSSSSTFITGDIYSPVKSNTAGTVCKQDNGVDELLAVLGYKVKSSDMVLVAEKLEHLEKNMKLAPQEDQRTMDSSVQQEKNKMGFEMSNIRDDLKHKLPEIGRLQLSKRDSTAEANNLVVSLKSQL